MPNKSCSTCGFAALGQPQCPVIGIPIDPSANHSCPYYAKELIYCERCKQIIPNSAIYSKAADGSWKVYCKNCSSLSGTCGGCLKSSTCDFETNPSPIPKAVEKRFQQGNQIMITQIKNPDRIAISCKLNCSCFSEEFGCCREFNTCGNYEGAF